MENNKNENMENNKNENMESNKKDKRKIIIIGVIVVILITGIIIWATVFNNIYSNANTNNNGGSTYIPDNPKKDLDLKPIIYLYPETTIEISVQLGKPENITCSYPEYKIGWNVIANPDGTLIDTSTGRKLYSLYWEGIHSEPYNFEEGFVVKETDVVGFLEEKLAILGLNEIEAEEFIVYWLPKLQANKYNFIRFATIDEINKNMPLEFSVNPDTIIRVLMQYKPLDNYIDIKEQELKTPERIGFVAVEWGGTELK